MSIADVITLLALALLVIGVVVIVGKYASFLHEQHMLYMAEKSPEIRIVNPALLLAPPKPKEPSRIFAAIERGIEQATIAAMQPKEPKEPVALPRFRVSVHEKTDVITLPPVAPEPEEEEPEEETIELEVEEEEWGEEIEEETIEEETVELEPVRLDLSLEEQAERDPGSYYDSIADILRRTVNYVESHDGIIVRDGGIAATSSDSYEIRQHERVSPQEWRHAFTHPKGIFWIAGILIRDAARCTRLHPEHQARFEAWYEGYLTPFREGLDEDDEEE